MQRFRIELNDDVVGHVEAMNERKDEYCVVTGRETDLPGPLLVDVVLTFRRPGCNEPTRPLVWTCHSATLGPIRI